tara:strand:+ start:322 stop:795 length:474 start_codon:yes stop_codon:yes gene_type:complete
MNELNLNIYNNLIKLTRNKNLYLKLDKQDTFSDRLIILFFHFGFFLKYYKNIVSKKKAQNLFDFFIKQIELSIREIGYGDVSVNKKMKEYVNLFYSIIDKIEIWESLDVKKRSIIIENFLNLSNDKGFYAEYFENYRKFLTENTLNNFTKDILNLKF